MTTTSSQRAVRGLALLVTAALLPILLFAGISAFRSLARESEAIEADALGRVRQLSDLVDRDLALQLDLAQSLAELPYLDPPADLARFDQTLRRLAKQQPLWRAALLAEPDGTIVVDTELPVPGRVADLPSLRRVIETGQPLIGTITMGQFNRAIPIRAPVVRDGRVTHVVTLAVRPDSIQRLLLASNLPQGWIGTVIDSAGRIVARTSADASLIGQPASADAQAGRDRGGSGGFYDGLSLEGIDTVSAFWPSPATNWSVHIDIPREVFRAPLRHSIWLTIAGAIASALLALLFALLLLREIRMRRTQLQAEEQTRRMESLGRLTGGVAHDFNNVFTVIAGNSAMLERRLEDPASRRRLATIRRVVDRGTNLTRQLLAYARGDSASASLIDVNERIRRTLGLLRQTMGSSVSVDLMLTEGLPAVEADPLQFDLALMNLALNARDAMQGGGSLTVATAAEATDGAELPGVVLTVRDTGSGISEEILEYAFEPFFTTKENGKGAGLGLTQVYGFAKSMGGTAEIASKVGRGTTVTLRLPASEAKRVQRQGGASGTHVDAAPGQRRLLIADDNDDVRRVTADYLRETGYWVEESESGDRAFQRLEEEPFDVVVTDIMMPGKRDGIALARDARFRWPDLPVILVSGYSAAATDAHNEGFLVLLKPYDLEELASEVAKHCDGPAPVPQVRTMPRA